MLKDQAQLVRQGPGADRTAPGPSPCQAELPCTPVSVPSIVVSRAHRCVKTSGSPLTSGAELPTPQCLRGPPCWFYIFTFTTPKCFL